MSGGVANGSRAVRAARRCAGACLLAVGLGVVLTVAADAKDHSGDLFSQIFISQSNALKAVCAAEKVNGASCSEELKDFADRLSDSGNALDVADVEAEIRRDTECGYRMAALHMITENCKRAPHNPAYCSDIWWSFSLSLREQIHQCNSHSLIAKTVYQEANRLLNEADGK